MQKTSNENYTGFGKGFLLSGAFGAIGFGVAVCAGSLALPIAALATGCAAAIGFTIAIGAFDPGNETYSSSDIPTGTFKGGYLGLAVATLASLPLATLLAPAEKAAVTAEFNYRCTGSERPGVVTTDNGQTIIVPKTCTPA